MRNINIGEVKGPTNPLVEMIEESMNLLRAYLTRDSNCEVIVDGQPISQHVHGPPTYDHVLQTIEATSESSHSYFRQLGAFVPSHISKKEFKRLFGDYGSLRLQCEESHDKELIK